ncbi:hypothetical protein LCGC14_2154480 [marine sediment metagenome]|uniref:Uncharacterized protein n=1 Tax=marine sediment metagenome TaxID=412755 RepID=A0A0F9DUI0_9ZZZZ
MDMDFQGIPDLAVRSIEERVVELEGLVGALAVRVQYLEDGCGRVASDWPKTKPKTVREEPDDARGKSLFKTVEKIQETDEGRS